MLNFSCEEKHYKYWFWMMTKLYLKTGKTSPTFTALNINCLTCINLYTLAGLVELS